jgi:hypothetical protein
MLRQQTSAGFFLIVLGQELREPNTDEVQCAQCSFDVVPWQGNRFN